MYIMDNMPDNFFVNLFGIMYIGMTPLVCVSSIIAEEKECNTLRVLLMFIGINAILALAAFIILYRKKGLENESNMAETIVISDNMIK